MELDGTPSETGVFLEPTVVRVDGLADAPRLRAVAHETFFPLLPWSSPRPSRTTRTAGPKFIGFVNSNIYGLRNSLWARRRTVIDRFAARVTTAGC